MINLIVTKKEKKKKQEKIYHGLRLKTKPFIHNTKIINNLNNRILGVIYIILSRIYEKK